MQYDTVSGGCPADALAKRGNNRQSGCLSDSLSPLNRQIVWNTFHIARFVVHEVANVG